MRSAEARTRTRAGLWLVEQSLATFGLDRGDIARIGFAAGGRPEIEGAPAFSVSHGEQLVACAMSDAGAIGIDIERRRTLDPKRLQRLAVGAEEQAIVAREPLAFFDYWCAREATVKASGRVGLKRMRAIEFDADTARLDARCWWLYSLDTWHDYAGCIAGEAPIESVELVDLSAAFAENTGR